MEIATKELELVKFDDPILYRETQRFDFSKNNAVEIAESLKKALIKFKGYGLTANQVGLDHSVFVFGNGRDESTIRPYFNPTITDLSGEEILMDEGCLSFPGMIAKIYRHKKIRFRYQDVDGTVQVVTLIDMAARIVQHEMCHIKGMPFFAGFSKLKVEMMVGKCFKRTGIQYNTQQLMNLRK